MQRLINEILERAKADRQRIVLPEGTEERTLKAANQILTDGIADLILLGNPAEINACATEWGLEYFQGDHYRSGKQSEIGRIRTVAVRVT